MVPAVVSAQSPPGVEHLDDAIIEFMGSIDCQAVTVAIADESGLLVARGYGYSDEAQQTPTLPTATMRIASCTKPMTAAVIHKLIREGKIQEDTPVFSYLKIKSYKGEPGDERLGDITIGHLLQHRGGFDRGWGGDPMFRLKQIGGALKLESPPTTTNIIEYMLAQRLSFEPGTKSVYSNFGYSVLGRVIEQATEKPYVESINELLEANDLRLTHSQAKRRHAAEVWYPVADDAYNAEVLDSVGGVATSSITLTSFMREYWITGKPRDARTGWNYLFYGSLPGTTAYMEQRPDGIDVAVLLNNRRNWFYNVDNARLRKAVNAAIDKIEWK